ncbi:hypothetical protein CGCTS75_v014023 [Colletotrichum tropicale]|nr:hypothetical protein CGCTS75_v014023 [Colletotrichum tropicale]
MVPQSKSSPSVLPYEVFLTTVEYLIAGIEAEQYGEIAWTYYRHDLPCKLVVGDLHRGGAFAEAMKQRHRDLRLPSQINQKSRKMVYQTFRPVPMCRRLVSSGALGQIMPVSALILPEVDAFVPHHAVVRPDSYFRGGCFYPAYHPPIPKSHATLDLIQSTYISSICSLRADKYEANEALLALPNLRHIMALIGPVRKDLEEIETLHGGRRSLALDYQLFSDLQYWDTMPKSRNLCSIWRRFQEKGIKLYGLIELSKHSPKKCIMEIFPSEDGTMVQYVSPNCSCCPRTPTSERRKLASKMRRAQLGC